MKQSVSGAPVSAAAAAGAMALIVARTEPNHLVLGVNTTRWSYGSAPRCDSTPP